MTDQRSTDPQRLAHRVVLWGLACGHTCICNCTHEVDGQAYCWICGRFETVTNHNVKYYASKRVAIDDNASR